MIKMMKEYNNIGNKNAIFYTIGLGLYCLTSLIFLIIVTRINGIEDAGIFSFGFAFANMIQVIANYGGRTFQVTENKKNILEIDFLLFKIFTCLAMITVGLIFCLTRQYDNSKLLVVLILIIYKALDAYSESIYGVFQKHNNLWQCGVSMTIKSVLCMLVFLICELITYNLLISVASIVLADLTVFIFYDCFKLNNYKIKLIVFSKSTIKYLIYSGFSIFIMTFLSQYLFMAQKYIIDFISGHEEQAILGIIIMPATFISMCANMMINPFLYDMNIEINKKNYKGFNNIVKKIILYVLLIGAFTLLICYFIGIPILNIIYGLSLDEYLWPLMIIVVGSIAAAIVAVISNSMIALRKNISQMIIYIFTSIFATVISYLLINTHGINGASLAFCLTMLLLLIMYIVEYIYIIKKLTVK